MAKYLDYTGLGLLWGKISSNFLRLSGGTLTGKLTISSSSFANQLVLNRLSDSGTWGPSVIFQNAGTFAASLGCDTNGVVYIGDNGSHKYKIWHENNDGTGSGLDADTLDGNHASAFATSSHTHNGGTSKTIWGQTYVDSTGSLQDVTGVMNITGSANYSEGIRIHDVGNLSSIWFRAVNANDYQAGMIGISANADGLRFRLPASASGTTPNDYMNIKYGGNVGIGTNSPTSKLHVVGNIYSSTYMNAGTYVRASGGDVYVGSAAGSQCHQQYDTTNKCLKFIFD